MPSEFEEVEVDSAFEVVSFEAEVALDLEVAFEADEELETGSSLQTIEPRRVANSINFRIWKSILSVVNF